MILALDYDDTFTLDPDFWLEVVRVARERGHIVQIVTRRFPTGNHGAIKVDGIDVIYTSDRPKRQHLERNGLPKPHVWIDDGPEGIIH